MAHIAQALPKVSMHAGIAKDVLIPPRRIGQNESRGMQVLENAVPRRVPHAIAEVSVANVVIGPDHALFEHTKPTNVVDIVVVCLKVRAAVVLDTRPQLLANRGSNIA